MPYEWLAVAFTIIASNGIEPHEVLQALSHPHRLPRAMRDPHGLPALAIHALTNTGRGIVTTIRFTTGRDMQIIAARDMTEHERKEYDSWVSSSR